jgi:hypothetical protein
MEDRTLPPDLHQDLKNWICLSVQEEEEQEPAPLPLIDQNRVGKRRAYILGQHRVKAAMQIMIGYVAIQGALSLYGWSVGAWELPLVAMPYFWILGSPSLRTPQRFGGLLSYEAFIFLVCLVRQSEDIEQWLAMKSPFLIIFYLGYEAACLCAKLDPLFRPPTAQMKAIPGEKHAARRA